jgi:predicted O-linked N-acetylglucosamine transferase (SPINDLY family)
MDSSASFRHAFGLHQQGRLQEAFAAYEQLLARHPMHAGALHFSGVVLHQAGQSEAAARRIEQSLRVDPSVPDPWCNLALVYQELNRIDAALNALQEALRRDPNLAEAWNNLAGIYLDLEQHVDAEQASRRATALAPRHGKNWFNLALSLQAQNRLAEALESATKAAHLAPGAIDSLGLKAQLEHALGRTDAALATLDAAIKHHPSAAALHFQRARIEEESGNLPAAACAYEQVLHLAPEHGPALSELLFLRKQLADWHDLGALQARFRAGVAAGLLYLTPFTQLSDPSSRAEQRRCAEQWSRAFAGTARSGTLRRLSRGRLRIGYVSADFYQHATALLMVGMIEQHDRERFEVMGYSTGRDDGSALRARLVAAFDRFVDARRWPAQRLAAQIEADGVDILVDLKGHTAGAPTAVFGLRPAPIQVSYLGYPGTMGADYVDYLIGDAVVTPFEHGEDYSEALVQLPWSYQVNDRQRPIANPPSRAELGLPTDEVVFCCFNSTYKLNPAVFDAWARMLAAVQGSVLWLLARGRDDPAIGNLRREAAARDIDAARLVFAGFRSNPEYLALYRCADLFLDTWPYNAHTTASDALWAGCPVLTWLGETFAGRAAASLLNAVGLPELVAPDVEHYVEQAIALAKDPEERKRLRAHLAGPGRSSHLFDTMAATRAIERAYLGMAEQYRAGRRMPFRVAPSGS